MESKSIKELVQETRDRLKPSLNILVDDNRVSKFLQANNKAPVEASRAIEAFIEYQRETLANFDCTPQEIKSIKQAYPHAFSGVDRQGRPVYIELIGSIKINDLFKLIEDQTLVSYFVQKMQYLYKTIMPHVEKKELLVIIDLRGQLTKMVTKRTYKIVNQIVTVGQTFYPNTLYKIVFVNTPMTWNSIWTSINNEIQPSTLKKMEFLGSDYAQDLHNMVDQKYLPESLGGKLSQEEFIKGQGPWLKSETAAEKEEQQSDSDEDDNNFVDFGALKAALSSVVPLQHQVRKDVASTPLNTEADDFS